MPRLNLSCRPGAKADRGAQGVSGPILDNRETALANAKGKAERFMIGLSWLDKKGTSHEQQHALLLTITKADTLFRVSVTAPKEANCHLRLKAYTGLCKRKASLLTSCQFLEILEILSGASHGGREPHAHCLPFPSPGPWCNVLPGGKN